MFETPRCHVCGATEWLVDEQGNKSKQVLGSCASCHLLFCVIHTSEFDDSLCSACVSFESVGITKRALVDEDNVTHKGSQLILTGEAWMRSRDVIGQMTDVELTAKLEVLKKAVHEAEMVLEYRRIIRNQVQGEISDRLSKKLSRLRRISAVDAAHKEIKPQKINGQVKQQNTVKDALGALGKMGLNKDAIANVLLKLAQTKAKEKP